MDADGSHSARLTTSPHREFAPAWSPDGHLIAFVSDRDGNQEIYVMEADGFEPGSPHLHPRRRGFARLEALRCTVTRGQVGILEYFREWADGRQAVEWETDVVCQVIHPGVKKQGAFQPGSIANVNYGVSTTLGENVWTSLAENHWTSLGENTDTAQSTFAGGTLVQG